MSTVDRQCPNTPILFITTEIVLVHCNIVNNSYQQDSRVLYTFFPNKSSGQLLDILTKNIQNSLTQIFHILKSDLLIKILNHYITLVTN